MTSLVHVEKQDGVAVVTIDNPPMNVMSLAVAAALQEAFADLAGDDAVSCVVLTAAGERAFMAGADIKEFPAGLGKKGYAQSLSQRFHEAMNVIDTLSKPTIAALFGYVLGGGTELALACDMRVCDEATKLGLPECKLGIFPGGGGTQRLPRLIGEARALQMMMTGEPVDASTANVWGLVNTVAPLGEARRVALDMARSIAARSMPSIARVKQAVLAARTMTLADGLAVEARLFDEVFQTEDSRIGIEAFIAKQAPAFKNR
ncbi:MAG: enoyl-CoA hydratase-related protein [Firmicutes bacterium]|nr:enoyl-CoA hydratase-related protein [Bacillota bacterium]